MKHHAIIGIGIAIAFLVTCIARTKTQPSSWNDISRIAAIESLVERGTWVIDHSPWFDRTMDKVFTNGKFLSDKMPLFSTIGAGVYAMLHPFGASLAPDCATTARFCAYPVITIILAGIPVAGMLFLFFDFALRNKIPLWAAVVGVIAFGLGTMIFPYATVFNHHAPAAASLFASFYLLARRMDQRTWLASAGLLAALAVSFDVLSGVIAASIFIIALIRLRARCVFFAIGAAIPVGLTVALDYQMAGTILPPYMIPNGYLYEGSAFPATFGGNSPPDDYVAYAFRMFLGGHGLFAYNPLLLFAFAGAVIVALNRQHPLWVEGAATAIAFVLLAIYLATNTGDFGGNAYGERWFVPAIPTLFIFIFFAPPLNAASWKHALWILFVPFLALSIFSSWQGAQDAWQYIPPPLQMTRSSQFPIFGFKWNMRFP